MIEARVGSAPDVRRLIAATMLGALDELPATIGQITLRPHQRESAARLAALIAAHGGALLAEPVGLGKTYTALAAAAHIGGDLVVAAPAALRGMWTESLAACGHSARCSRPHCPKTPNGGHDRSPVRVVSDSH